MGLRELILNHEKVDYIQRVIRKGTSANYRKQVLKIDRDPLLVQFHEYGNLNSNKNIYYIKLDSKFTGFFGLYTDVLSALYYAERFSLIPVVEYPDGCLYEEENGMFGTDNVFEYYFQPVSNISVEELKSSKNVVVFSHKDLFLVKDEGYAYNLPEEKIENLALLQKKYIKLRKEVQINIENDINNILKGKRMLGMHVRGTDYKAGYKNHPRIVSPQDYLECAKKYMNSYEKIFLATDDIDVLKLFINEFGNRCIFYEDNERSSGTQGVHLSEGNRKHHKYLLGYEVLRDMLTISFCDSLIAGVSNVSLCSQITKRSRGEKYQYIEILDTGVNKRGKIFSKSVDV